MAGLGAYWGRLEASWGPLGAFGDLEKHRELPKRPQEPPERLQEGPKRLQVCPKEAPAKAQEASRHSKKTLHRPLEVPRRFPRSFQEATKKAP